jgi:hypothetical protein
MKGHPAVYHLVNHFEIKADGTIERTQGPAPSAGNPPPISVRIMEGVNKQQALHLLRRLCDQLEAMP